MSHLGLFPDAALHAATKMHNLIQEKDLTRRKEWLEKQKAALGLFSLEKKRLRSNLIKCISSWWDGVRQTEQGSSQRCPVTRPETVSTVRKTENSLLTLRKKKKIWGLKNAGYTDN